MIIRLVTRPYDHSGGVKRISSCREHASQGGEDLRIFVESSHAQRRRDVQPTVFLF